MKTYIIEITFIDGSKSDDVFTPDRVKRAFNFGNGTDADMMLYLDNNKSSIKVIDIY